MQFPPPDNPSSWAYVFHMIDEYPDDEISREYKSKMKEVLAFGIEEELHEDFRAGMGMHDVIFSTALKHGLRGELQVAMSYQPKKREFYVAYARRALVFGDPIAFETVGDVEGAYATLKRYLARLWKETKLGLPYPPALRH